MCVREIDFGQGFGLAKLTLLAMPTREYCPYNPHQLLILLPSLQEWLPEDHLAYFINDLVDGFDLQAIAAPYEDKLRGAPPYHPAMMVKVVPYAYCTGVYSSHRIARRLHEDIAFRALAAGNTPDFRTISDSRKQHLAGLSGLFTQVLALAQEAGLVKLGHVALDWTKLRANASKHKVMSYGRMTQEEGRLAAEADTAENAHLGPDVSGDEVPEALCRREGRLRKIREAMAAMEARARVRAETKQAQRAVQHAPDPLRGRPPKPPRETPQDRDQYNFTDPELRIMKNADGAFIVTCGSDGFNVPEGLLDGRHPRRQSLARAFEALVTQWAMTRCQAEAATKLILVEDERVLCRLQ